MSSLSVVGIKHAGYTSKKNAQKGDSLQKCLCIAQQLSTPVGGSLKESERI